MKRRVIITFFIVLLSSSIVWAQQNRKRQDQDIGRAKKELKEEVTELQAQRAREAELKKSKPIKEPEIDIAQPENENAYALGVVVAQSIKSQLGEEHLPVEVLLRSIGQTLRGEETLIKSDKAQDIVQRFFQQLNDKKMLPIKKENSDFLAANATREGVHTTASGLQYKVIKKINGDKKPTANSSVTVHYAGRLISGKEFDSSIKRGEPASFPLSGVIAGWTEGLQLMGEGDKFEFYIPYNLAYGERGSPPTIPPFATLIFDVELIKVN